MPAGREHEIAPVRGPGETDDTGVVVGKLARGAARSETGRQRHEKDRNATHRAYPQKREVPSVWRHDRTHVGALPELR